MSSLMVQVMLLQEEKMQSNIVKSEILESQIINKKVQTIEPIMVTAKIHFVINQEEIIALKVEQMMKSATEKIISAISKHQHKKVIPTQRYAKTAHAAAYIDVDESFLNKRKGKVFKLGKHFFKPPGQTIVRWDIEALGEWIQSEEADSFVDEELAELLERS